MDPEPAAVSSPSYQVEQSSTTTQASKYKGLEDEDPLSLSRTSIALIGLVIALATIGIPITAVLTERSMVRKSFVPSAMEIHGSKTPFTFSFTRVG